MDTDMESPKAGITPASLVLQGQGRTVRADGALSVPSGCAATLEDRAAAFFAGAGARAALGGALPFDKTHHDRLWQVRLDPPDGPRPVPAMPPLNAALRPEPSERAFAQSVAAALHAMDAERGQTDALAKIVLARTLAVTTDRPIPLDALFARLARDPAVMAFHVPLPDEGGGRRSLVGATPELLIRKEGARIASHPLAGSARRHADAQADKAAAQALLASDKDRREHAVVVEYILDTLAPWCSELGCPGGAQLTGTGTMWHLGTAIEGRLRDPAVPSITLASMLHPTPAVCGRPRDRAAALIARMEPVPRGFYAGAVGWCDGKGHGVWHVAIRCAEVSGSHARLYAGAGIVPGSDPRAETAETGAKFGALLAALGLPPIPAP